MPRYLEKLEALAFLERLAESYGGTIHSSRIRHIEQILFEYTGTYPKYYYSESTTLSESDLERSFTSLLEEEAKVFTGHSLWSCLCGHDSDMTLEQLRRKLRREIAQFFADTHYACTMKKECE